MTLALALSRMALGMGVLSLLVELATPRSSGRRPWKRRMTLALATFALGMGLFALFFGLVAACDWM